MHHNLFWFLQNVSSYFHFAQLLHWLLLPPSMLAHCICWLKVTSLGKRQGEGDFSWQNFPVILLLVLHLHFQLQKGWVRSTGWKGMFKAAIIHLSHFIVDGEGTKIVKTHLSFFDSWQGKPHCCQNLISPDGPCKLPWHTICNTIVCHGTLIENCWFKRITKTGIPHFLLQSCGRLLLCCSVCASPTMHTPPGSAGMHLCPAMPMK